MAKLILAAVEFGHQKVWTKEEQEALAEVSLTEPKFYSDSMPQYLGQLQYGCEIIMSLSKAAQFGEYKVLRYVGKAISQEMDGFQDQLVKMSGKAEPTLNQRLQVVVPSLGVLALNQVRVCVDMCTNALQAELDDGWRIVAVCPQPDQRRPDYILGRSSNTEHICESDYNTMSKPFPRTADLPF
jgi:hypothetical protein